MADYERPSFNKEWWSTVEEYLRDHPEEGFAEDDVKQFIKYATNKYMNKETSISEEDVKNMIEELRE